MVISLWIESPHYSTPIQYVRGILRGGTWYISCTRHYEFQHFLFLVSRAVERCVSCCSFRREIESPRPRGPWRAKMVSRPARMPAARRAAGRATPAISRLRPHIFSGLGRTPPRVRDTTVHGFTVSVCFLYNVFDLLPYIVFVYRVFDDVKMWCNAQRGGCCGARSTQVWQVQ